MQNIEEYLLPGDSVTIQIHSECDKLNENKDNEVIVKLNKGLFTNSHRDCFVVRPGYLQYHKNSKHQKQIMNCFISTYSKVYFPSIQDCVIGIIRKRHSECYMVDINTPSLAYLSILEFEGATKRNKPDLDIGDAVYAKVVLFQRDIEPIISCIGESSKSTNTLGPLKPKSYGTIFECTPLLCNYLSKQKCPILETLGKSFRFDIILGCNGRVFIESPRSSDCIALIRHILSCDKANLLNNEQQLLDHIDSISHIGMTE